MFHSSDCGPIGANFLDRDKMDTKVEPDVQVKFTVTATFLGAKMMEMTM